MFMEAKIVNCSRQKGLIAFAAPMIEPVMLQNASKMQDRNNYLAG